MANREKSALEVWKAGTPGTGYINPYAISPALGHFQLPLSGPGRRPRRRAAIALGVAFGMAAGVGAAGYVYDRSSHDAGHGFTVPTVAGLPAPLETQAVLKDRAGKPVSGLAYYQLTPNTIYTDKTKDMKRPNFITVNARLILNPVKFGEVFGAATEKYASSTHNIGVFLGYLATHGYVADCKADLRALTAMAQHDARTLYPTTPTVDAQLTHAHNVYDNYFEPDKPTPSQVIKADHPAQITAYISINHGTASHPNNVPTICNSKAG